jgi:hypothetical protein
MTGKRGRWVRNPFFSMEDERRRMQDIVYQGWSLRGGREQMVWVEDEDKPKAKTGPKAVLTADLVEKAISWLLEKPERLKLKQDTIREMLNELLGIKVSKTVYREKVIGPATEEMRKTLLS